MKATPLLDGQEWAMGALARLGRRLGRRAAAAPHLLVGLEGERTALFALRRRGYRVVARRWTSSKMRGDVDLVAWDGEWLCFVEVKTRSERSGVAPAEMAVDEGKRRMLRRLAMAYLRAYPEEKRREIAVRFDVVAVHGRGAGRSVELYQGAFGWR